MSIQKLTEIAWIDSHGVLHISVPGMLKELGIADTPDHRRIYSELAAETLCGLLKNRPANIHITE